MERSCSPGTGMALWQHTLLHQQSWSLILHLMLMTCCVYWYTVFSFPNTWKMSAWFGSQCVWALQKCSAQLLHFGWLKCELCLPTGVCLDFVQTEASEAWEVYCWKDQIEMQCDSVLSKVKCRKHSFSDKRTYQSFYCCLHFVSADF